MSFVPTQARPIIDTAISYILIRLSSSKPLEEEFSTREESVILPAVLNKLAPALGDLNKLSPLAKDAARFCIENAFQEKLFDFVVK